VPFVSPYNKERRVADYQSPKDLTDEQSAALDKAAFLIINARNEAAGILTRSAVPPVPEEPPEQGWFGSPCTARLPFPPHPRCGCSNYKGDGGPCTNLIRVPITGPDPLHPLVPCGHRPWQHVQT